MKATCGNIFKIKYKNYKGITEDRRIKIKNFVVGSNEYHKEHQLLIEAEDVERKVNRTFAAKDVLHWYQEENLLSLKKNELINNSK